MSEVHQINPVANYHFKIKFDHFKLSQKDKTRSSIDMVAPSKKLRIFFDQ